VAAEAHTNGFMYLTSPALPSDTGPKGISQDGINLSLVPVSQLPWTVVPFLNPQLL
jgi:hypothetical protein